MSAKGNFVDHEYEVERDGERRCEYLQALVPGAGYIRRRNRAGRGRAHFFWRSPSASTRSRAESRRLSARG